MKHILQFMKIMLMGLGGLGILLCFAALLYWMLGKFLGVILMIIAIGVLCYSMGMLINALTEDL